MRKAWRIVAGIIVLLVLTASVMWLARPQVALPGATRGQLTVVAVENFWGNIAAQLGGDHVYVTSIITNANVDPHLYESNAANASAVASADVVIINGLGYDDFMNKLLDVSQNSTRQVLTVADILQAPPGTNQHLWYDVLSTDKVAAKITAAYIAQDPAHKSDYQDRLKTFDESLQPLDMAIGRVKQLYVGTPVAYTEPVAGDLLNAMGLDVKTPPGFAKSVEDGDDPSPADTNAMDALMTSNAVKLLVYNAQATSAVTEHVKALAVQAGIPVVGVNEIMPSNETSYQSWMQDEINAIQSALGNKR